MKVNCPNVSGYSVKFSPFNGTLLACCGGSNFGLQGSGSVCLIDKQSGNLLNKIEFPDAVFDCCWSELDGRHLVCAGGDGSVTVVDIHDGIILNKWKAHGREIFGVEWNPNDKSSFLTCSWDHSIKQVSAFYALIDVV